MAFSIEDLQDLLALLRQHPEWRDAVRREVLSAELLELPAIVAGIAASQERLTGQMQLMVAEMRELGRMMARLDGRVGNLEGWRYQEQFNARARVTEILRRPVEVDLADLDPVLDARDGGRISVDEWKQLLALDFLLRGRLRPGPDAPERFVALEVSQVVDSRDVQRAHDRAAILSRVGLEAIAAVGGSRLTQDAAQLADRLGVRTLVGRSHERRGGHPAAFRAAYLRLPPDAAAATPSPMNMLPEIQRPAPGTGDGRAASAPPCRSTPRRAVRDEPERVKTAPSARICAPRAPRGASTNYGRKARKNSAVFGFSNVRPPAWRARASSGES
jgi:hypothetical protein